MNDPNQKIEQLKEATRSANEVLSDLKRTLREIKQIRDEVDEVIATAFEEKIADKVSTTLADYQESLNAAIDKGTQAVFDRFDTITKTLLGETKEARRKHGETVPEALLRSWCTTHQTPITYCGC